MSQALVPLRRTDGSLERESPARRLMAAFLRARNEHTLRAYRKDLDVLAGFMGASSREEAAEKLLQLHGGRANELALNFQASLVEKRLSPATINRRMSTLRALAKLGRMLGMVTWRIEVENLDSRAYRDTKGPGELAVSRMLDKIPTDTAQGIRNEVIVRGLHDMGLRRGDLVGLDLEHWSLERSALFVLGKKRLEREWVTVPPPTCAPRLKAWLEVRGDEPGPMFQALDGKNFGHRLTGASIFSIIRKLGVRAGVVTRPHGIRHTAITEVLNRNGGNLREAARFSRHKNLDTLQKYDDNRLDLGGKMAALIALPERAPERAHRPTPREAFAVWVEQRWPGADPLQTTARALATFVRDYPGDRGEAWRDLGTLRPWSEEEVATMKKILNTAPSRSSNPT